MKDWFISNIMTFSPSPSHLRSLSVCLDVNRMLLYHTVFRHVPWCLGVFSLSIVFDRPSPIPYLFPFDDSPTLRTVFSLGKCGIEIHILRDPLLF